MKLVRHLKIGDYVARAGQHAIVLEVQPDSAHLEFANCDRCVAPINTLMLSTWEEFDVQRKNIAAQKIREAEERKKSELAALQKFDLDTLIDEIIRRKLELKKPETITSGSDNTQIGYKAK